MIDGEPLLGSSGLARSLAVLRSALNFGAALRKFDVRSAFGQASRAMQRCSDAAARGGALATIESAPLCPPGIEIAGRQLLGGQGADAAHYGSDHPHGSAHH